MTIHQMWSSIEAKGPEWESIQHERRKTYWGVYAEGLVAPLLPLLMKYLVVTNPNDKVAIDLGCGNSQSVSALLRLGWKVIAVDDSKMAIDALHERLERTNLLSSGRLEIVHEDISSFTPREPVDLVIATDVLPYLDPKKLRATWTKIHDVCLKNEGIFIGTFIREIDPFRMQLVRDTGAWTLPDSRMVSSLLVNTGYSVEECIHPSDAPDAEDPIRIQFMAKKVYSASS